MNDPLYSSTLTEEFKETCYKNIRENIDIRCLSFGDETKSRKMKERFQQIGLDIEIFEGIPITDPRIADDASIPRQTTDAIKRLWSVTYGHLTNIENFYKTTDKEFCIICENDVLVNKNLPFFLPQIMLDFKEMGLDTLLLGYMATWRPEEWMEGFGAKNPSSISYKYLNYPDNQWGIHGLMLDKKGAKLILDSLMNRADEWINHESGFSPDWTITKIGNRALITPMFIVEDGQDGLEHYGDLNQWSFHRETWKFNAIPDVFV